MPDISYYGLDKMNGGERKQFLAWYETRKAQVFIIKNVLETFSQEDVTVLRQACHLFRSEFNQIGKIEGFLESLTIASACNKVLRRKFLKPDTIGLMFT